LRHIVGSQYEGFQVVSVTSKKQLLLQRAARLMGGDRLAKQLGIPEATLQEWTHSDVTIPDGKLPMLAAALLDLARSRKS
jgi:hypothetical protein